MDRRRLLKALPAALLIPLSGCGGDGNGSTPSPTDTAQSQYGGDSPGFETASPTAAGSPSASPTDTRTRTPDRRATVPIGEVVADDRMSMVVKSVSKADSLGQFQQADEGNTYAVVRLEVKNTTRDRYADFSSFLQTQVQDSDGYTYSPTLSMGDSAFQGGQLAPGEVARGDVAFELPEDASGLTLQFDFSTFSFFQFDRVTVDLSKRASQIGDLEQSLHVTVHDVGERVTHDGVAVTVNSVGFRESLGQFTQAGEGNTFAIIDVTTANDSDETVTFSSLLQMSVKDGTGMSYAYSASATAQLTRAYDGGDVSPDGKSRGKIAYEIPKNTSPLYFVFEFSVIVGGSRTFWRIN